MPHIAHVYIRQVIIGFILSAVFVGLLFWFNVANLWHLVSTSDVGWIAAGMLFFFNGIVFAGVQFAITIMRMGDDDDDDDEGGRRDAVGVRDYATVPVPVSDR